MSTVPSPLTEMDNSCSPFVSTKPLTNTISGQGVVFAVQSANIDSDGLEVKERVCVHLFCKFHSFFTHLQSFDTFTGMGVLAHICAHLMTSFAKNDVSPHVFNLRRRSRY